MSLREYEDKLYQDGINYIAGVDEAGRGPLYGPVVAACVLLPKDFYLEGLNDSKKLTAKKRDIYYEYITKNAISYGIGIIDSKEIDEINIYQASKKAMYLAIEEANKNNLIEHILIDAMPLTLDIPNTSIIHGDALSYSIAAASVIAKVTRDRMLDDADLKYPMYGFKNHKGYPTKKHLEAIEKYGLIDGYRLTYGPINDYLKRNNLLK